jgi:hypothetical protein
MHGGILMSSIWPQLEIMMNSIWLMSSIWLQPEKTPTSEPLSGENFGGVAQKDKTIALFASTYQPGLLAMVQCFSLTTKQHQPAYPPAEQLPI